MEPSIVQSVYNTKIPPPISAPTVGEIAAHRHKRRHVERIDEVPQVVVETCLRHHRLYGVAEDNQQHQAALKGVCPK